MDEFAGDSYELWARRRNQVVTQPIVYAVSGSPVPVLLVDPNEPGLPIIFASQSFLNLTGYDEREVLGRNCRFLQGPDTDPAAIRKLREALEHQHPVQVEILNYRKDGTTFWNELQIAPIFDDRGGVMYLIGSQVDVTERVESKAQLHADKKDLQDQVAARTQELANLTEHSNLMVREAAHRVKNSLAILASLVEIQRRGTADPAQQTLLREVQGRIRAVAQIQELLEEVQASDEGIGLAAMMQRLRSDLAHASDADVQVMADTAASVSPDQALPVALAATELVLNAQKHAFKPGLPGQIKLRLSREASDIVLEVEDNGLGLPAGFDISGTHGTGLLVVRTQVRQLGGTLDAGESATGGAVFRIRFPSTI